MVLASLVDHYVNMCGLSQLESLKVAHLTPQPSVLALATQEDSDHHLWETTTTVNQAIQLIPLQINSVDHIYYTSYSDTLNSISTIMSLYTVVIAIVIISTY